MADEVSPDRAMVDAVLAAARVLVAISLRSVAATDGAVTVAQLRVLLLVAERSVTNVSSVAVELGVHRSNATRVVDRLVRSGLLERRPDPRDRRHLVLEPTEAGRRMIAEVEVHRRTEIAAVLARIPSPQLDGAARAWSAFAAAGSHRPDGR